MLPGFYVARVLCCQGVVVSSRVGCHAVHVHFIVVVIMF